MALDVYFVYGGKILSYEDAPYKELGELGESLGFEWGGRWKKPFDPGHFQYRKQGGKEITTAKLMQDREGVKKWLRA